MRRFGVDGLADRYPDQLSGGQAQRVAILRAVATRPQVLLLDEPFSALDPATRADLQQWLTTLTAELGVTVLLVTHDVEEALALAQRVVLLADGGRIQRQWRLGEADQSGLRDEIPSHYRVSELWVA
jgi:sulfate transport system ATP-binding protein